MQDFNPTESFADTVESVLQESGLSDAPAVQPSPTIPAEDLPDHDVQAEPEAAKTEPIDEDPEVEVPGVGKLKVSEIKQLQADRLKADDYTRKTQAAAKEREEIAQHKAQLEIQQKQLKDSISDPAKLFELQRQQGVPAGPSPILHADQWRQARAQDYARNGWDLSTDARGQPNNPEHYSACLSSINQELSQAQTRALMENQARLYQEMQNRDQATKMAQESMAQEKQLQSLMKLPANKMADNDEGRELVTMYADAARAKGQAVNLPAIVAKVAAYHAKLVKSYAQGKQQQARSTAPLQRGGGAARAPETPEIKGDNAELYDYASRLDMGSS